MRYECYPLFNLLWCVFVCFQRLMAQLIRTSSSEERKKLLEAAFEPKQSVLLTMEDSDEAPPEPEVPPPQFIELAKAMIQNFGNLQMPGSDEAGLRDKLLEIASEAEQVGARWASDRGRWCARWCARSPSPCLLLFGGSCFPYLLCFVCIACFALFALLEFLALLALRACLGAR